MKSANDPGVYDTSALRPPILPGEDDTEESNGRNIDPIKYLAEKREEATSKFAKVLLLNQQLEAAAKERNTPAEPTANTTTLAPQSNALFQDIASAMLQKMTSNLTSQFK